MLAHASLSGTGFCHINQHENPKKGLHSKQIAEATEAPPRDTFLARSAFTAHFTASHEVALF